MMFFMEHTMAYLNSAFVRKQKIGMEKYKQVVEHKTLVELDDFSQYIKFRNFEGFPKWFECKISDVATNL